MPEEILETPQPTQPVTEPKSSNWPKIILAAVLGIGLLAGATYAGYWYGTESAKQPASPAGGQPKTQIPEPPTPTPSERWRTFVNDNEKAAVRYSLEYPDEWELKHEQGPRGAGYDDTRDRVALTKDNCTISIYQAASTQSSRARCLYPGESKEGRGPTDVYREYSYYVEMGVAGRELRRAKSFPSEYYTPIPFWYYFCEEREGTFYDNTSFGAISYEVPTSVSESVLNEMDSIVKTLQFIK